jgi:hypothetical protein
MPAPRYREEAQAHYPRQRVVELIRLLGERNHFGIKRARQYRNRLSGYLALSLILIRPEPLPCAGRCWTPALRSEPAGARHRIAPMRTRLPQCLPQRPGAGLPRRAACALGL